MCQKTFFGHRTKKLVKIFKSTLIVYTSTICKVPKYSKMTIQKSQYQNIFCFSFRAKRKSHNSSSIRHSSSCIYISPNFGSLRPTFFPETAPHRSESRRAINPESEWCKGKSINPRIYTPTTEPGKEEKKLPGILYICIFPGAVAVLCVMCV